MLYKNIHGMFRNYRSKQNIFMSSFSTLVLSIWYHFRLSTQYRRLISKGCRSKYRKHIFLMPKSLPPGSLVEFSFLLLRLQLRVAA